jgi:hypothetical protein
MANAQTKQRNLDADLGTSAASTTNRGPSPSACERQAPGAHFLMQAQMPAGMEMEVLGRAGRSAALAAIVPRGSDPSLGSIPRSIVSGLTVGVDALIRAHLDFDKIAFCRVNSNFDVLTKFQFLRALLKKRWRIVGTSTWKFDPVFTIASIDLDAINLDLVHEPYDGEFRRI